MIFSLKKNLIPCAAIAVLILYGYFFARSVTREDFPGENDYRLSNKHLEEKNYQAALESIDRAVSKSPGLPPLLLTRGIILMFLGLPEESRTSLDSAIALKSDFAEAYANRGILHDRAGRYKEALNDYRMALGLNPKLAEGPGRLWRFIRNVQDKQITIRDRAAYIENEMKKPAAERKLKYEPEDRKQRMHQPGKLF